MFIYVILVAAVIGVVAVASGFIFTTGFLFLFGLGFGIIVLAASANIGV